MMDRSNFLGRAVALVVTALLIIGLTVFIMSDAPREEQPDPHIIALDITNSAQMHQYGLPTKVDVLEWHMHGQWGYKLDGTHFWHGDLPGMQSTWDELYGIDPDNPAFKQ